MNNFQILNLQPPLSGSSVLNNNRQNPTATIDNPFAGAGGQSPVALLMLGNVEASHGNRSVFLNNNIWQWTMEIERSFTENFVTGIAMSATKEAISTRLSATTTTRTRA